MTYQWPVPAGETGAWLCAPLDDGSVHIVPLEDLVAHEPNDCPCGPDTEFVANAADGPDGWLITHHSLDAREASEPAAPR